MAGGILDLRWRMASVQAIKGRARECLSIATEVYGLTSLVQFEQRAKLLLTKFFHVATTRITFLDRERQELIAPTIKGQRREEAEAAPHAATPAVGKRHVARYKISEGIVGR